MFNSKLHTRGFTLIELLVVISIIGMLSSVVLVSLNQTREKARRTGIVQQMRSLVNAAETYRLDHGDYGTSVAGFCNTAGSMFDDLSLRPVVQDMLNKISSQQGIACYVINKLETINQTFLITYYDFSEAPIIDYIMCMDSNGFIGKGIATITTTYPKSAVCVPVP